MGWNGVAAFMGWNGVAAFMGWNGVAAFMGLGFFRSTGSPTPMLEGRM
jgi:hypothetical protein